MRVWSANISHVFEKKNQNLTIGSIIPWAFFMKKILSYMRMFFKIFRGSHVLFEEKLPLDMGVGLVGGGGQDMFA